MNGHFRVVVPAAVLAVAMGATLWPLAGEPPDSSRRTVTRLDAPGEYARWRNLSLRGDNGLIADNGLMRAKAQAERLRALQPDAGSDAGINRGSWTSLGPGNVGGRIRAIVIRRSPSACSSLASPAASGDRTTAARVGRRRRTRRVY